MIYYPEHGIVDSPFVPDQMRLVAGAGVALKRMKGMGFYLFLASNQPGIAKGYFSEKTFEIITKRMNRLLLTTANVKLDGEFYCFHHPLAKLTKYRIDCMCRKPKPGLILEAAKAHNIKLEDSYMIGDGLVDVQAGRAAGCTTILVSNVNALLVRLMDEQNAYPDYVVRTIAEAADAVAKHRSLAQI
jgi:D-glycero-D-manno-heptose 1,7-bisphosphate phosphatase